jgi:hypothetical protein
MPAPGSRQNFRKTDTARMIRAAQDAGLRITGITLDRNRVVLQVEEPVKQDADEPRAESR